MEPRKSTPATNVSTINRRQALGWLGAAGTVAALAPGIAPAAKPAPLRVLILGGTAFLGPALVEQALDAGHRVTLFNRGKTAPDLFKGVEQVETLLGDRNNQLETLQGREWDLVIDTSGYVPRQVRLSAELLAPRVKHYVFISSISVYAAFAKPNDETSPVARLTDPTVEQITGETYGGLKALCEEAAEKAMPKRVTNIRPGLIVGPRDRTDRFTYWPARIDAGGEVLSPRAVHHGRAARELPPRVGQRRQIHLGGQHFPCRPAGRALVRHASVDSAARRGSCGLAEQHAAGYSCRAAHPYCRRHGTRHAGVAPPATGSTAPEAAFRPDRRT